MKRLGHVLDFDSGFVDECVTDLLSNKYITEEPAEFSSIDIAKSFVKDGIKIVLSNNIIESREFKWLVTIAEINGISDSFYTPLIEEFRNNIPNENAELKLEIENYLE